MLVTIIGFIPSFFAPSFKHAELPVIWLSIQCFLPGFTAYFHYNFLASRDKNLDPRRNGWSGSPFFFMMVANVHILYAVFRENIEGTTTCLEGIRTPKSAGLSVMGTGYPVLTRTDLPAIAV